MHVLTGKKHTFLLSLLPKLPAHDFCSPICVCNDRSNWILESILNRIGEPTIEVNPVIAGSLWTWYCITHSQKIKGTTVYLFKHTVWCRSVLIKKTCKQLHGQKKCEEELLFLPTNSIILKTMVLGATADCQFHVVQFSYDMFKLHKIFN